VRCNKASRTAGPFLFAPAARTPDFYGQGSRSSSGSTGRRDNGRTWHLPTALFSELRLPETKMIRQLLVVPVLWVCLALPAVGGGVDATTINSAEFDTSKPPAQDKIDAVTVKAQILLDRAQFSPGEIDGKLGENAQKALRAFAEANSLAADKPLTPEIWTMLSGTSKDPVVAEYTLTETM
jgi:hypothetical protein